MGNGKFCVHSKSHLVDSETPTPLFVSVIDFELWQRIHIGVDPPNIKAARGVDKKERPRRSLDSLLFFIDWSRGFSLFFSRTSTAEGF